jgi:F-type H+-transporting ATPase subunit b
MCRLGMGWPGPSFLIIEVVMGRGFRSVIILGLALILLCGTATVVGAAPDSAQEGGDSKGLLDPRFDLGIWTIVVFFLLYLVLRYVKLPGATAPAFVMMLEGLKKREENIHKALEDALRARDEAQKIQAELKAEMAQAAQKVHEMIQEARRDGQELKNQLKTEAQAENQKERERLYREIDTARDQALQQIWNQAAQLAAILSSKVIRRKLTPDDHRILIDEALGEFQTAGSNRR